MKRATGFIFVVFCCGIYVLGQNSSQTTSVSGAKSLYYDQTSGNVLQGGSQTSKVGKATSAQPVNLGLKYWVELVQPNSTQILRVSSTSAFHSGERIRLHFESNVDGRIALTQINSNGTAKVLFPDARINNGNNVIKAGKDTVIPSDNAWFTFDDKPGIEQIVVFLGVEHGTQTATPHKSLKTTEPAKNTSPVMNVFDRPANGTLDTVMTASLKEQAQEGGKSLMLEIDSNSDAPADYAVKPTAYDHWNAGGLETLAMEIKLKHQ